MVYFQITKKTSQGPIDALNKHLSNKNSKIFVLYFMEGCGPCNATRPEWAKLENVLSNDFLNKDSIAIVSVDHELCGKLKNIGSEPNSFPTMRFMTDAGKQIENYEDSNISKKDRTIDSFVEWIKNKTGENNITITEMASTKPIRKITSKRKHHPRSHNNKLGGKTRKMRGENGLPSTRKALTVPDQRVSLKDSIVNMVVKRNNSIMYESSSYRIYYWYYFGVTIRNYWCIFYWFNYISD